MERTSEGTKKVSDPRSGKRMERRYHVSPLEEKGSVGEGRKLTSVHWS